MYPTRFHYVRATSPEHALHLLHEHGEEARVLAGGASLIPLMKLRMTSPAVLIDIGRLSELGGVRLENGAIAVGAVTRHADIEADARIWAHLPLLRDVAASVGDTQIRNMGTVGGSLAEADPAGDWAPTLLALGGRVRATSADGARTIGADALFRDAYTTALQPDELLTEVIFPIPGSRSGAAHAKFEVRAGDYAVANCVVGATLDETGRIADIAIGLGAVGLMPLRATRAEELLRGQIPDPHLLDEATDAVATCTESYTDARGSARYRQHLGGVVFRQALTQALQQAGGRPAEDGGNDNGIRS